MKPISRTERTFVDVKHLEVKTYANCCLALMLLASCTHSVPPAYEARGGRWADVGKSCTAESPTPELPAVLRESLGNPFDGRGRTGPWAQRALIARDIPGGWGGVTHREKGLGFAIYLLDTAKRAEALDALVRAGVPYISTGTEARVGRWAYVQLYDWFRYIHTHLRRVPVTMWSLDESRNRVLYGVETEEAGLELDRQLAALKVPCFLVFREVTGPIRLARVQD
jgi:hypothetical protein